MGKRVLDGFFSNINGLPIRKVVSFYHHQILCAQNIIRLFTKTSLEVPLHRIVLNR